MNYRLLLLTLLLGSLAAGAQEPAAAPDTLAAVITGVQKQMAPDLRLAVFRAAAEMRGDTVVVRGESTVLAAADSLAAALGRAVRGPVRCEVEKLPHHSLGDKIYGVIAISTASLYRGPHYDREIVNQALLGDEVTILRKGGVFTHIQLSDGYVGYTDGTVVAMNRQELEQWQQHPRVVFLPKWGEIRAAKSESSLPVSDLVAGVTLAVAKREGKWLRIVLPDGREGYVRQRDVMEESRFLHQGKPRPEQLVATACRFLGTPYFWGGFSAKGLDCSGFTKTVYKLHGITLPRDANMQVKAGREVVYDSTYAALQPGDLLFFGRSIDHITHVGMYISDYRFIHAADWVLIASFNPRDAGFAPRRLRDLRAVRRLL